MEVKIKRTKLDEVEKLSAIHKEAFAEDYALYEDHDSTPVNETAEKLIENIERFSLHNMVGQRYYWGDRYSTIG